MRSIVSLLLASTALGACVLDPAVDDAATPTNDSAEIVSETAKEPVLEVIATGANIAGANGIHFGPDGLLYITSVIGSDLTLIDPVTGEELKRFTAADGVIGPDDVAFASDGSYYWTSILTGEVAGFTPNGDKIVAAQLPPGPNPITFSDDDRLFVSQCFLGTNVYELDPQGVEPPRLIADDLGPGCGLNGMDWGPDDRLYGPRWFTGEVVSLDVETGTRRVEATGFQTPAAIKFDSRGRLHVLDTGRGELVRLDGDARAAVAGALPRLGSGRRDGRAPRARRAAHRRRAAPGPRRGQRLSRSGPRGPSRGFAGRSLPNDAESRSRARGLVLGSRRRRRRRRAGPGRRSRWK